MKLFGLSKNERLSGKKSIDQLFLSGESVFVYPLKAVFSISKTNGDGTVPQALFVVPRKRFKRAVHRNLLRRRIREAYRLSKSHIKQKCAQHEKSIRIAFLYVSDEKTDFQQIQSSIESILRSIDFNISNS